MLAQATFRFGELTLRTLCRYHRYEVFGFEHLPRTGPALVVFHHSLATYDSFLLGVPMLDRINRMFKGLAGRQVFATPGLGHLFRSMGFVDGTREATIDLLRRGEIIGLAPGGMREALRHSRNKYQIDWHGRLGFVWVSMLSGAPIVLAACPRSDDLFDIYPNPITPRVYDRLRLPAPLFRGLGLSPMPRPVKLWHLLSEPILADVAPDRVQREDVEHHHARLCERMSRLMRDSLEIRAEQRGH
jgi:1-acyl-sn-glycerol-3-phosphate acyltransferase